MSALVLEIIYHGNYEKYRITTPFVRRFTR